MTSKFDPKQLDMVINEMYEGASVTSILKKHNITKQTFYDALAEDPLLEDRYTRAQMTQTETNLDEMKRVAYEEENPQRAKNILDVLKWVNERLNPRKYGARIDLNVNTTVDLKGALTDARSRVKDVIDIAPKLVTSATGHVPVEGEAKSFAELIGIDEDSEK